MQGILTAGLVAKAFELTRPCIELVMNSGVTDGKELAVVVAATRDIMQVKNNGETPDLVAFEKACYLVTSIGDVAKSSYPLAKIALSKAELSHRTGLPTAKLLPQHLLDGDTVYWGSAVLDGIVVGCSGLDPHHDEMFAYWIAAAIQAEAYMKFDEIREHSVNFVP